MGLHRLAHLAAGQNRLEQLGIFRRMEPPAVRCLILQRLNRRPRGLARLFLPKPATALGRRAACKRFRQIPVQRDKIGQRRCRHRLKPVNHPPHHRGPWGGLRVGAQPGPSDKISPGRKHRPMAAQRQFKIARQPQMRPPLAPRGGQRMLQQRQELIRRQLLPQGPADLAQEPPRR